MFEIRPRDRWDEMEKEVIGHYRKCHLVLLFENILIKCYFPWLLIRTTCLFIFVLFSAAYSLRWPTILFLLAFTSKCDPIPLHVDGTCDMLRVKRRGQGWWGVTCVDRVTRVATYILLLHTAFTLCIAGFGETICQVEILWSDPRS